MRYLLFQTHICLSVYIGHFSNMSGYFSDRIDRFIFHWAQLVEFDSGAGRWSICCKHNCLPNTDLQTEQVVRNTKCITYLLKIRFCFSTDCCIICKYQLHWFYKEIIFLKHLLTGKKWCQVGFEPISLAFQVSTLTARPLTPLPPSTLELKGCMRARLRPWPLKTSTVAIYRGGICLSYI